MHNDLPRPSADEWRPGMRHPEPYYGVLSDEEREYRELVIPRDTAERFLRRVSIAGIFTCGMLIGAAIKWWLS